MKFTLKIMKGGKYQNNEKESEPLLKGSGSAI